MGIVKALIIFQCRKKTLPMNISSTPGVIKKFGRTPWKFQATFVTPSKKLDSFVETIVSANEQMESGTVTIDSIVHDLEKLSVFLNGHLQSKDIQRDFSFVAEGTERVKELLIAAFSDWINFLFIPMPKPFVIYADHDEFATFYANTKSNLNSVVEPLLEKRFKQVINWRRQL